MKTKEDNNRNLKLFQLVKECFNKKYIDIWLISTATIFVKDYCSEDVSELLFYHEFIEVVFTYQVHILYSIIYTLLCLFWLCINSEIF